MSSSTTMTKQPSSMLAISSFLAAADSHPILFPISAKARCIQTTPSSCPTPGMTSAPTRCIMVVHLIFIQDILGAYRVTPTWRPTLSTASNDRPRSLLVKSVDAPIIIRYRAKHRLGSRYVLVVLSLVVILEIGSGVLRCAKREGGCASLITSPKSIQKRV